MLTRENTKQLKGLAVLLMLAHHLFPFPDRIPYGMSVATNIVISEMELTAIIGMFGKICVSIFMFLGGYGLFASCNQKDGLRTRNVLTSKLVKLYKSYWRVFLIFIPLGFLFFRNYPQWSEYPFHIRFSDDSFVSVISSFLGWTANTYNGEWWFFKTYVFALAEGMLFLELYRKNDSLFKELGAVILWSILVSELFPNLTGDSLNALHYDVWYSNLMKISHYSCNFFVGIIFCKYKVFDYWWELIKNLFYPERFLIALAAISVLVYADVFILSSSFHLVITPIFLFAVLCIIKPAKYTSKVLAFFGKHSTNMWLTHSFMCYYFYPFAKIVYGSGNAIVAYLTLVALSVCASYLVNIVWFLVGSGYKKLRYKIYGHKKLDEVSV